MFSNSIARNNGLLTALLVPNMRKAVQLLYIMGNQAGLTLALMGAARFASIGRNRELLCPVKKKGFYGPFPASCAISIDLRSHFHLSVLPWSAAFERMVAQDEFASGPFL